jgi:poly(glycerol-phosphate) alpha-glucosyltransferase
VEAPIAVIPNGIAPDEFSSLPAYESLETDYPALKGKRRALFLSRIHPKKGLDHLLIAWKNLGRQFPEWRLFVTGSGDEAYETQLRALAGELGIAESLLFTGPAYGDAKRKLLAGADLFVLPSFSEGFSMAVLEAAASGLPVLLTPECNFPELAQAGAALEREPNQEQCENALRRFFSMNDSERRSMGAAGHRLVHTYYTWPKVAAAMLAVYTWLLRKGDKPDCVRLN